MKHLAIRVTAGLAVGAGLHAAGAYAFRRNRRVFAGSRRHFLVTQGGLDLRPGGDEFQDAVLSVMMGGAILDLRAVPPNQPARLDLMVLMGGVQILVPEVWKVQCNVEVLMGGVEVDRRGTSDPDRPPDLVLTGRVVFGGVEITSRDRRRRVGRSSNPG